MLFVVEPINMEVSGVTGSEPPASLTPNPRAYAIAPDWVTAREAPVTPNRDIALVTYAASRSESAASMRPGRAMLRSTPPSPVMSRPPRMFCTCASRRCTSRTGPRISRM
jgi:hypothetical protein